MAPSIRADLDGLDAVVHLAGAGIGDHRWTDEYKALVLDSRVLGTTLVAKAIADSGGPRVLLSASAIGIYGSSDAMVDERSPLGDDFPARVGIAWEASTAAAEDAGVRVAHLRTGIVLSGQGGALKKMLPLFKFGLGGRFGDGRQWMSWISIDDEVRAIEHLLDSRRDRAGQPDRAERLPQRRLRQDARRRARAACRGFPYPSSGPSSCSAASSPTRWCSARSTSLRRCCWPTASDSSTRSSSKPCGPRSVADHATDRATTRRGQFLTIWTSTSIWTLSPTITPPVSSGAFHSMPKSLRLTSSTPRSRPGCHPTGRR